MIDTNTIFTLNVRNFQFYPGIVWYPLWSRHYYFLPDISNLLQAKERTARWWEQSAYNKSRRDVWSASKNERIQSGM